VTRAPSWERVARVLAARMAYHSGYCPDGDDLAAATLDAACPFCADHAAYALYLAKAGPQPDPLAGATRIDVNDLRRT
jgi:hypothetical protein